ncbi:serine hydrolase [Bradyrhizobium tropiciagri]|uniref:serine hydrolase domain-containing protein n=1 Tax=Bradyrhizobium tropiciagri TaxID=312253 RepID=UPI001BAB99B4|nr:serine hydrolase [Bradyrhizobium tropiciagri]MBR0873105.1 serine hydrolase [Bradyrhizobium tropiciagri]
MISLRYNWKLASTLACLGSAAAAFIGRDALARAAGVPVHFASHQLCSATFVAGLDPTQFFDEAIRPKLGPLRGLIRYEIDQRRREVRTSLAGLVESRAVHDGPFGCRVLHPGREARFFRGEADDDLPAAAAVPPLAGPDVVAPVNAKLAEALEHAFAESETGPRRFTKAVVVLHKGRIVGERYAPGVTPATPLIGWSMTKSVTNALLGILVRDGKLDMYEPAPIAEWSKPADPRRPITPDQLLRMTSGLSGGDSAHTSGFSTIFDPDTQMEYDMADQSAFAASIGQRARPGQEWRYTNCNFVLLSRIIRDLAGGDAGAARKFIARELFEPVGFQNATLEYDSAGVPLGTIHLWASARDWARFGLFYLRDGVTENGRRILPEGWVDYSAKLTPPSADEYGYGAGFWTQRGNSAAARSRIAGGFPADSFMAAGSQGQYAIVMPSQDLVIVKIGWAYTANDDRVAVERLVRETIAALHSEG